MVLQTFIEEDKNSRSKLCNKRVNIDKIELKKQEMENISISTTTVPTEARKSGVVGKKYVSKVDEVGPQTVKMLRIVDDATMRCRVFMGPRENWEISTGIKSFDRMLELFAQYSKLNLDLHVESKTAKPNTWVVENVGRTLGEALNILAGERSKAVGIKGLGYSQGLYGEAFTEVRILLRGKIGCWMTRGPNVKFFGRIGEVSEEAMKSFFTEFAQAANGTLHVDLIRGEDPHSLWCAAFIAFGEALGKALTEDEWYKQRAVAEPIA